MSVRTGWVRPPRSNPDGSFLDLVAYRRTLLVWIQGLAIVTSLIATGARGESAVPSSTETFQVRIKLRTGGALDGLVVDHTPHGLVVAHDNKPYVFAWKELESGSAYVVRRALLDRQRNGRENCTAEDHYRLGLFALSQDRPDLASAEFRRAGRLEAAYTTRAREAVKAHRQRTESFTREEDDWSLDTDRAPGETTDHVLGLAERVEAGVSRSLEPAWTPHDLNVVAHQPSEDTSAAVLEVYRAFGATVQQAISKRITLVETDHFLIWTDWQKHRRPRLARWCEAMYDALCAQFQLDPHENIFLAKCPVFCFRAQPLFRRFARQFDGYDTTNSIGYTRSISANGHVHVVLLRQGSSPADFDRLATTLVHEGTHAFLHRLHSTRLIPHWVNEGYADLIAERVLGHRCPTGENAALLAKQYIRYDWPIDSLLNSSGPIAVHEYPLAHSVVAYLERFNRSAFAGFIRNLKEGQDVSAALAEAYDDMTLKQLEAGWRTSIRTANALSADRPTSR